VSGLRETITAAGRRPFHVTPAAAFARGRTLLAMILFEKFRATPARPQPSKGEPPIAREGH